MFIICYLLQMETYNGKLSHFGCEGTEIWRIGGFIFMKSHEHKNRKNSIIAIGRDNNEKNGCLYKGRDSR